MNIRRALLALMFTCILVPSCIVMAQDIERIPRVGFLASGNLLGTPQYEAFLLRLRELGYVEGKTIHIEHRWIDRDLQRLPALAAELTKLPVDIIVTWGSPALAAARQVTTTIPIVMIAVADPVKQGIVSSLAKPGGNITGMSNMLRGTIGKNVEMLVKITPNAKRIAVLRNPDNPSHGLVLQEVEAAALEYDLQIQVMDVNAPEKMDGAISAIRKDHTAGLLIIGDPLFMQLRQRIAALALQAHLPSSTIFRQYPESGGLMSYGLNTTDMFRHIADYVGRILKGAKPADLPIEHPTTYELVINANTAKALGARIPDEVMLRADKVIE